MTHFLCIFENRPSFFFSSGASFFFLPLVCFGGGASAAELGFALVVDSAVDALELAADDRIVLAVELRGKIQFSLDRSIIEQC